jgi:hypothetical protein
MAMRLINGFAALALLGAALGLGACTDMVVSTAPVFTADESTPAPKLKPGFWAGDACIDQRFKAEAFCIDGYMISDKQIDLTDPAVARSGPPAGGDDYGRPPFFYRLGVGDPLLMQVQMKASAGSGEPERPFYVFLALDPKSRDDQGRIDRADVWFVKCGPPAPPKPGDMGPRPTEHPFAGVTMTDYGCAPTDRSGLFSVARASRALPAREAQRAVYRWISERPPVQPTATNARP